MPEFSRDSLDREAVFAGFEYHPTDIQKQIHASRAKYRAVACGVRWGKTTVATHEALAELMVPGTRGWVVTPTYGLGDYCFKPILRKLMGYTPELVRAKSERDRYVRLFNNAECEVKSAADTDSLIGASLDFIILDEAARIGEEAMEMCRARLVDRDGWMLAISTPTGRNWFERFYRLGQDDGEPNYESWNAPTWTNPFLQPAVIADIKANVPERVWRQEYAAEFLDDDGAVFRNVDACATVNATLNRGDLVEAGGPQPGRPYLVSWDVGKYSDYSVVLVWDVRLRSVVYGWRGQGDWPAQIKRVSDLAARYNRAPIHMDATGEGDAVFTMLCERNRKAPFSSKLVGVRLHNPKEKRDLVENLALGLERMELSYPRWPVLLKELRLYEYERKEKSGNISYHAPFGGNDDAVMALALGWAPVSKGRATGKFKLG